MDNYSDLLKNDEWKKKRIIILKRDNFTCTKCKNKDTVLHVHHKIYIQGRNPWDYESKYLVTLCGSCHSNLHETKKIAIVKEEHISKTVLFLKEGETFGHIKLKPKPIHNKKKVEAKKKATPKSRADILKRLEKARLEVFVIKTNKVSEIRKFNQNKKANIKKLWRELYRVDVINAKPPP